MELDKHLSILDVQRDLLKKDKNYAAYAYLTKADLEGLINSKYANKLSHSQIQSSDDESLDHDSSLSIQRGDLEEKKERHRPARAQ